MFISVTRIEHLKSAFRREPTGGLCKRGATRRAPMVPCLEHLEERRVQSGYSRQCPSCETILFFEEGSGDKNAQKTLREAMIDMQLANIVFHAVDMSRFMTTLTAPTPTPRPETRPAPLAGAGSLPSFPVCSSGERH